MAKYLIYLASGSARRFGSNKLLFPLEGKPLFLYGLETLAEAAARYREETPRGEFVLVVGGAPPEEKQNLSPEQAAEWARRYLEEGLSAPEAAKRAAREAGVKKGEVYRLLVEEGSRGGEG